MSDTTLREGPTRRLAVALGGCARDEAALLLAARLARQTGAELSGWLLEDADLPEIAALPVTGLLVFHTTERRRLDPASLARGYRVEARRLRRLVASVSERHLVRWNFEVRRVRTCADLARPLVPEDLLVITPQDRAQRRRRLGEALACEEAPAILILEPGRRRQYRHAVILHGKGGSGLVAGGRLAHALEIPASIVPLGSGQGAPQPDQRILRTWFGDLPWPLQVAEPVAIEAESLRTALARLDPDIVVIGRERALAALGPDTLDEIIGPRAVLIAGTREEGAEPEGGR